MRRLTRKKLKQNEFVSVVDEIIHWFTDNWRPVVAGIVAVCGIFLIWWGVTSWQGSRASKAAYALNEAVQIYQADQSGKTPKPADLEAAKKKLEAVVAHYGRTDQGDVARLYLARMAFSAGDAAKARGLLKEIVARHRGDVLGRLALVDLIHLRVGSGEAAEVAKELEKMLTGKDDSLPRDMAMFELGRVYVKEKKPEQAKQYFQKLVKDFPQSPYQSLAQQQIQSLG